MYQENKIKGLSYLKGIKPYDTKNYSVKNDYVKSPDYQQDIVSEITEQEEMFLNLLYSDSIYINACNENTIVIGNNAGFILIVDLLKVNENEIYQLSRILGSPATKIFKEGKNTLLVLKRNDWKVNGTYFDTSIANKLLGAEKGNASNSKTATKSTKDINEIIHECKTTIALQRELVSKVTDIMMTEFSCIEAVVEMEMNGVYVNKELLKDTQTEYAKHINPTTNRIHACFEQIGTATGRIITSRPSIQNVSRDIMVRQCFQAEPGNVFVISDYSQIELRIVAEITKDSLMLQALKENKDLHALTASLVLNKNYDEVTSTERQAAKAVNYGLIYGMGVSGLVNYANQSFNVELTKVDAQHFRNSFFQNYKGIRRWHEAAGRTSASGVESLGGRTRIWPTKPTTQVLCNSKVQATTSDILKRALILLMEKRRFYNHPFKIIHVIHDEIILETVLGTEEKAKEVLERAMIKAGQYYLKDVPVAVDIVVGTDWSVK